MAYGNSTKKLSQYSGKSTPKKPKKKTMAKKKKPKMMK
tara:strand:- start:343 stop:456 length:114 start_codon:yes stop_codon:yes gene_type:complete